MKWSDRHYGRHLFGFQYIGIFHNFFPCCCMLRDFFEFSSDISGGGQAKICGTYAENLFRVIFGTHPPFFSMNNRFFPQHFQDPPIFFRKCKFFPLKFGDPPTFLWKIHIYQIFDPLTSRPLSVLCSLFCDFCFFMSFLSFWAIQACKIVKNGTFLMFFF